MLTNGARKPSAKWISLQLSTAITHSNFNVLKWLMTTAASGRHPDNFHCIWLEQIHPPPGTWLPLRLCAPFAVMLSTNITVIAMTSITTSNGRRLISRLSKANVCP